MCLCAWADTVGITKIGPRRKYLFLPFAPPPPPPPTKSFQGKLTVKDLTYFKTRRILQVRPPSIIVPRGRK